MARKRNQEWKIDDWDDSLDQKSFSSAKDPFSVPTNVSTDTDDWDEGLPEVKIRKRRPSVPGSSRSRLVPLVAASCALLLAAAVLVFFFIIKPRIEPDPPTSTHKAKPINTVTSAVAAETTVQAIFQDVTQPPAESSPETAPESTPVSGLQDNEWYGPELRYYYQQLTAREKEIFDKLYSGIVSFDAEIDTGYFDETELQHVMSAMNMDCPELFQRGLGYSYSSSSVRIDYRMSQSEYQRRCRHIHNVFNQLKASFTAAGDDFDKQLLIYRYLIDHCDYLIADDKSTAYADTCLCDGQAQCEGYATALNLLLRCAGIQSICVHSEDHSWNIVRINGDWYNCDVTFDDTGTKGNRIPFEAGQDEYNAWMNLPDRLYSDPDHLRKTESGFTLPSCSSLKENYACRMGNYVDPETADPVAAINDILTRSKQNGKNHVLILIDNTSAVSEWDSILDRLYNTYGTYNWVFYPPKAASTLYAIPSR